MQIKACYLDNWPNMDNFRVAIKLDRQIRYADHGNTGYVYCRDTFQCSDNVDALMLCWGGSDYGSIFKDY